MKKSWILAPVLAALLAGCTAEPERVERETTGDAPQVVRTEPTEAKVEIRDVTGYEFLNGRLFTPPESQVIVTAPADAPVRRILTSEGQRVGRGEVLVELGVDAHIALEQAQADLLAARTAFASAEAQFGGSLRAARQQLEDARATERQIREATLPGGDASELALARQARQDAQSNLARVQAEFNAQMLPYRRQVEAAQAAVKQARLDVKQNTVEAPISGTVTQLMVQSGDNVPAPEGQIAEIVDLDDMLVIADVLPNQHELVEDSEHVYIRFNEFPDKVFDGHVIRVEALPARDGSRVSHEARIDFSNDAGVIKPNATVRSVGIVLGRVKDALAIPVGAVDRDETGKAFVSVKSGDQWVRTVVELGLSDGDYVVVKSGLEKDQIVQVIPGRNEVGPTAETVE